MSVRAATPAGRRRSAARSGRAAATRDKPAARNQAPSRAAASRRPAARRRTKPRRARPEQRRRQLLWAKVALLGAVAMSVGYFGWFRDSSLVAVRHVSIDGLSGGAANPAAAALTRAAEGMTTLDFDESRLEAAAAPFPEIAAVSAHPSFPHGLDIDVMERPPVVVARAAGEAVPVAADGTILRQGAAHRRGGLPSIAVDRIPSGARLHGAPRAEALIIGAAPRPLRREIDGVADIGSSGVTVRMRGGIELRFGSANAAVAKWAAAAAVLADRRLTAARYVDVRVPGRPAIG
jgi:cell division protein FtsQ